MASAIPEVLDTVTSFLDERHQLLIGGKWVPAASGETFTVENPSSEKTIAHVAKGGEVDVQAAVTAALCRFPDRTGCPFPEEVR